MLVKPCQEQACPCAYHQDSRPHTTKMACHDNALKLKLMPDQARRAPLPLQGRHPPQSSTPLWVPQDGLAGSGASAPNCRGMRGACTARKISMGPWYTPFLQTAHAEVYDDTATEQKSAAGRPVEKQRQLRYTATATERCTGQAGSRPQRAPEAWYTPGIPRTRVCPAPTSNARVYSATCKIQEPYIRQGAVEIVS